jgi:hypothetical protein
MMHYIAYHMELQSEYDYFLLKLIFYDALWCASPGIAVWMWMAGSAECKLPDLSRSSGIAAELSGLWLEAGLEAALEVVDSLDEDDSRATEALAIRPNPVFVNILMSQPELSFLFTSKIARPSISIQIIGNKHVHEHNVT